MLLPGGNSAEYEALLESIESIRRNSPLSKKYRLFDIEQSQLCDEPALHCVR